MFLARKQISLDNICRANDSATDAFFKKGFLVSDTLAIILTNFSTCLGAKDNKPVVECEKFEEIEIFSTNYLNSFQKDEVEQSQRGRSPRSRGKPSSSSRRNHESLGAT